jgi:hypothetical protein
MCVTTSRTVAGVLRCSEVLGSTPPQYNDKLTLQLQRPPWQASLTYVLGVADEAVA